MTESPGADVAADVLRCQPLLSTVAWVGGKARSQSAGEASGSATLGKGTSAPSGLGGSRQASNEKEYTLWLNALKEAQQGGNGYRRWLDKARVGIGPIRAAVLLNSEDAERTGVRFVPFITA